ncbi:hypothetical protein BHZ80_24485 [Salmonella enterica]|nr:hypothetical protein [Salmonella enterica]EBW8698371.1 hypothetical protein [Salmonella enterica subsp. diarizonae serovar 16:z10:e,n,x,z15]EAA9130480.1 hypothetical protein [Salmonella enterica]EAA9302780.1 hypothetical protein [Salmonella enterica]EAA9598295.1 hypothetical protein [Salmonella enterica]
MRTSELFELLNNADTSLPVTVDAPPLTKEGTSTPLYIDKWLSYDIIILLETMQSDITFDRYKKTVECLNVAELSVDTEKVIVNLTKLIKQKSGFSGKNTLSRLRHWFQMTVQKARRVTFSIPLLANEKTNKYVIHYRENTGIDIRTDQPSLASSITGSGKLKTQNNYMVCIEENNKRIKRWDREIFGNEAKWRSCPPDKFEILGKMTLVYKVVRD